MRQIDIDEVLEEIKRLETRINSLHDQTRSDSDMCCYSPETGAIRRASMDLTRALSKLRKN